jgi:tetratricopeptide (TPR) repeat protein
MKKGGCAVKKLLILTFILCAGVSLLSAQSRGALLEAVTGKDVRVGKQWAVFIAIDRYREWGPLNNPQSAIAYHSRVRLYSEKGDWDKAIADYSEVIRLYPQAAEAYAFRGNVYHEKGDYNRAIADCTQAIRLDPQFAAAYNNRGLVYEKKKDYDRAIADYTEAIRLDPQFGKAYGNRGNAYKAKGDTQRAEADSARVKELGWL